MSNLEELLWKKIKEEKANNPNISVSELSRKYKIDRQIVKKYLESAEAPKSSTKKSVQSKLEPYKDKINELIQLGKSSYRIYDIIKELGYDGKLSLIKDYMKAEKLKKSGF